MVVKVNNKEYTIKDSEITKLMKTLEITETEAIDTWLCDHDIITNGEVENLTAKAKASGTAKIKADGKVRKKTTRPLKENPLKEQIIANITEYLAQNSQNLQITNLKITNKTKMIDFTIDNREFSLNLVEHRAKK